MLDKEFKKIIDTVGSIVIVEDETLKYVILKYESYKNLIGENVQPSLLDNSEKINSESKSDNKNNEEKVNEEEAEFKISPEDINGINLDDLPF